MQCSSCQAHAAHNYAACKFLSGEYRGTLQHTYPDRSEKHPKAQREGAIMWGVLRPDNVSTSGGPSSAAESEATLEARGVLALRIRISQ